MMLMVILANVDRFISLLDILKPIFLQNTIQFVVMEIPLKPNKKITWLLMHIENLYWLSSNGLTPY
jgi:hypothetical protein